MSKINNNYIKQIMIFNLSKKNDIDNMNKFLVLFPNAVRIFVSDSKMIYEYETEFEVSK